MLQQGLLAIVIAFVSAICGLPVLGQSIQSCVPADVAPCVLTLTRSPAAAVAAIGSSNVVPGGEPRARQVAQTAKPPLPPGFLWSQTKAGIRGGAWGGLIGGLAGAAVGDRVKGWEGLYVFFGAWLGGYVTGSAVGVHRYSNSHGVRAPFAATLAGAVAGLPGVVLGGFGVVVTVPFGAAVGHNMARRGE